VKLNEIVNDSIVNDSPFIPNPFRSSREQRVLFHGTRVEFKLFNRPGQGIYVTPSAAWAEKHYGTRVIALYANVTRKYEPSEEEIGLFYDMNYPEIKKLLQRLSARGYNCIMFGGESESMVLFNNIELVNADDGTPL